MSIPQKNNNPGSLRNPKTGEFNNYATPQDGFAALLNDLQAKQQGTTTTGLGPSSSLVEFAEKYAPKSDGNDPARYAASLANRIGVRPDAKLKDLDLGAWASAVARNEDSNTPFTYQPIGSGGLPSSPQAPSSSPDIPSETATQPQEPGLAEKLSGRVQDAGTAVSDAFQGKMQIPLLSAPLQVGGAIAGGIGDVVGAGLGLIPGVKQVEGAIGSGVQKVAQTPIGQKVVKGTQDWAANNPEEAKDIGSTLSIGATLLGGVGSKAATSATKEAVGTGVTKGLLQTPLKGMVERSATRKLAASATDLTPTELKNVAGRVTESGALIPSKTENRAGQLLAGDVSKNPVKNYRLIKSEVEARGQEAEDFLSNNAKAVSNKEDFDAFNTMKQSAKRYLTSSEAKAYNEQINVFQRILKGYGEYNTANYYKALKEFESQVTARLPKGKSALLVPGGTARLQAAKDVRKAVRDLIASKHPEFKGKMFDLASLYDALGTTERKVAKYAKSEKAPGMISGLVKAGAKGIAQGAGFGGLTHFIGD